MISETVKKYDIFYEHNLLRSIVFFLHTHTFVYGAEWRDVIASVGMNLWLVKPKNEMEKKTKKKFNIYPLHSELQRLAF